MTQRTTADRLEHARELLIRAVAQLTPIDPDDAPAHAITAEIEGINERIARLIEERAARAARVRWHGDTTHGPLHATVNGAVAGTLIPAYLNQWTLTDETVRRYPTLYGIGPRALSTWRAKLATAIREYGRLDQPPVATR